MKRQIRKGCWETNSSSTCSLVIMPQDDYNKWSDGNYYYYDPYNYNYDILHHYLDENYRPLEKQLYSEDQVKEFLLHNELVDIEDFNNEDFENLAYEFDFYSLGKFDGELETMSKEYKLPDGNVMVAHCAYGYDY